MHVMTMRDDNSLWRFRLAWITILLILLAWLLSQGRAAAQMIPGIRLVPVGYCQLTAPNTATLVSSCTGFATFITNGANVMLVRTDTQAIRWRDDGTAPTTTVGMPLLVADPPFLYSGTLSSVSVISAVAGANVNITFYKSP